MSDFSKRIRELSPQKRALLLRRVGERLAAISRPISPVVEIQTGVGKRPFFCVHPSGGAVLCYADLAHFMGPDQPFYGLQSPGLIEQSLRLTSIEEMATEYIAALRDVQSCGPYFLGGWSMGALVAYEMAQQLTAQKHEVGLLALLDMWVITEEELIEIDDALILMGFLGNRLNISPNHLRQLEPDKQIVYVLEKARQANVLPFQIDFKQARRIINVCKNNDMAAQRYQPKSYPGKLTLFRAAEYRRLATGQGRRSGDPTLGWGAIAEGGVVIYSVPGDHDSLILKPRVKVLAELLKTCIDAQDEIAKD